MYIPDLAPLGDSLALSALVAALPLLTLFVTLGLLRWKAHWAGLAALAVALGVAVTGYGMPLHLALLSGTQGAVFGLFPIMWIVLSAIWLYQITVVSGRFEDLHATFDRIHGDPRVQAIIIAFCFGGLLEALAGFGAPVAITGVMLMAIGFSRLRAAAVVLLANTAPVAFGAIAIPIITAGNLTGIPYEEIGAYVGRQTPLLAAVVPLLLVFVADGRRGVRETWPVALTVGVVFGVAQFVSSNFVSVELTDIIASLAGLAAAVLVLRVWQPRGGSAVRDRLAADEEHDRAPGSDALTNGTAVAVEPRTEAPAGTLTGRRVLLALFPYLLVIAVFSVANLVGPIEKALTASDLAVAWPGLGDIADSSAYKFQWLSSPGTLLLLCGVVVAAVYRVPVATAAGELVRTVVKLRFALLTVAAVLALAYVMNLAGMTVTMGTWIAGAGAAFAFLSPVLGWLGTAVTGSDTSANALFATLQQTAAVNTGLDPTLLVAANTSGGVVGKMISPQNLTIAATAVGLVGRESEILRKVLLWSLGLLVALCLLVGLQSTILSGMLP
ncbi:L-lactate permease [Amycolatopsis palatopharyngis]|uniref:L-lactate permease n=1 Tax=Amycolatopsis palatopharyngis TaxID=187982 RepID=UPI000E223952|nr:L-lactate permease [Amycolatopsis palatopharyngis]